MVPLLERLGHAYVYSLLNESRSVAMALHGDVVSAGIELYRLFAGDLLHSTTDRSLEPNFVADLLSSRRVNLRGYRSIFCVGLSAVFRIDVNFRFHFFGD